VMHKQGKDDSLRLTIDHIKGFLTVSKLVSHVCIKMESELI